MTNRFDLYRCEICGNIIQILHEGSDALVCCGKPMKLLKPHTNETENQEKHVPVFTDNEEIQIGSFPHPMTNEHHIEFLQTITKDKKDAHIHFFCVNDAPKISLKTQNDYIIALEYCNLHGLWQGDKNF